MPPAAAEVLAAAAGLAAVPEAGAPDTAALAAGRLAAPLAAGEPSPASSAARLAANLSMIRPLTSAMTPRPNWAGRPVTLIVVCTTTLVWPPSSCSVERMVAEAVPAPRVSFPDASSVTVRACSSRSTNLAVPA